MKKILYFIIGAMLLTSCEDFLDSSNKTKKRLQQLPANRSRCLATADGCIFHSGSSRAARKPLLRFRTDVGRPLGRRWHRRQKLQSHRPVQERRRRHIQQPVARHVLRGVSQQLPVVQLGRCGMEQRGVEKQNPRRGSFLAGLFLLRPCPHVWRSAFDDRSRAGQAYPNRRLPRSMPKSPRT